MLVKQIELLGCPAKRISYNGLYYSQYFNDQHELIYNNITYNMNYKAKQSLYHKLLQITIEQHTQCNDNDLHNLSDFIEKCLIWDTKQRYNAEQLLKHKLLVSS